MRVTRLTLLLFSQKALRQLSGNYISTEVSISHISETYITNQGEISPGQKN